ncbi:ABC transporter substrate-binding protein [Rhodococcus koreensis]|uniref:NitT/TauT family transport system substrate-binding protein n=1 Tax=Rhodococcus koreensis TaxID=99653 RepID=A0A1H4KUS7_9NOCA|nr:ABC transporter substrate-binding protein [Rhodococcus koreensis]SEB61976.1 NitT/TauT family transport system substrate-binding protein [Rhodococcus koreensis]
MFTKRPLAILVGAVALALAATGCSGTVESLAGDDTSSGEGRSTLTLQDSTSYTQLPIRFGVEKGFFDEEDLDVRFTQVQDAVTGVATGELTFAFGPTSNYLRAAEKGSPIKIVSSAFRSKGPFFLVARPGINSVADLKGKTVGIAQAGSSMETYTRKILSDNGVNPDDVSFIANGVNEQAYGTLTTGQVDATIIHQPFPALGELDGKSVTLARGWDYLPTYHTGVLIAGNDVINDDPELLRRGLSAYFKSYTYAKEHYDEYLPWLQAKLGTIDPKAVELALQQEDDIWDNNPAIDPVAIADTQDVEIAVGFQDARYDADKYIDTQFIPQEYVKDFSYPQPAR